MSSNDKKDFQYYLKTYKEVGFVEEAFKSVVYVSGLPQVKFNELIMFETGEMGQIILLKPGICEVLVFTNSQITVGTKVARMGKFLEITASTGLLGQTINSLGKTVKINVPGRGDGEVSSPLDKVPEGIEKREKISRQLVTGVSIVDLAVPIAYGQRELVIGNRRTGKTQFLLQAVLSHIAAAGICVYAAIAKRGTDLFTLKNFITNQNIWGGVVLVESYADDPAGMVYLTPYTAMTIAEYFASSGRDVLVVFDDLLAHAKYYREISILAKRFPGRNSYPGDIFFTHSKLIERAGAYKKGTITALPVAELVFADLGGYIQTNLMSMTDGHLYFDSELHNAGRRPAINTFLSVTRVGFQTQSVLLQDIGQRLNSFFVQLKKLRAFSHFGAELTEKVKADLELGDKMTAFFDQEDEEIRPINESIFISTLLWSGFWKNKNLDGAKKDMKEIMLMYKKDKKIAAEVDAAIGSNRLWVDLEIAFKQNPVIAQSIMKYASEE